MFYRIKENALYDWADYKFAEECENVIAMLRISNTLKNLGITNFTIKTTKGRPYFNGAIIVRIPK